jgi:hypothetical protein
LCAHSALSDWSCTFSNKFEANDGNFTLVGKIAGFQMVQDLAQRNKFFISSPAPKYQ